MSENYKVKKLDKPVDWTVEVPGSKSMTNRALLIAALADGRSLLKGVLFSDDSRYFLSSLQSLGFEVAIDETAKQVAITGLNGRIPVESGEIYVGSAGTAARFLTAMLAMAKGTYVIQASEQMKKRPMKPLFDVLAGMGAQITYLEEEGFLPIQIRGIGSEENVENRKPRKVQLDISKSTQFLSALMLISPMIKEGLEIEITSEKKDGSYIRITRQMVSQFGVQVDFDGDKYCITQNVSYQAGEYQIEPDVSAACYFYAAAAVTGGRALVKNVTWECMQGDLKFVRLLEALGCRVEQKSEGIEVFGVEDGKFPAITIDMNDFSDQTMTLAAIAPFASGVTHIRNVAHIRLQESDRMAAIIHNLTSLGIRCEEEKDGLVIYTGRCKACEIETYEDHRMAIAFSIPGLLTDGVVIKDPMCCRKTFENYFEILDRITK